MSNTYCNLPLELIENILSYSSLNEYHNLHLVNKQFNQAFKTLTIIPPTDKLLFPYFNTIQPLLPLLTKNITFLSLSNTKKRKELYKQYNNYFTQSNNLSNKSIIDLLYLFPYANLLLKRKRNIIDQYCNTYKLINRSILLLIIISSINFILNYYINNTSHSIINHNFNVFKSGAIHDLLALLNAPIRWKGLLAGSLLYVYTIAITLLNCYNYTNTRLKHENNVLFPNLNINNVPLNGNNINKSYKIDIELFNEMKSIIHREHCNVPIYIRLVNDILTSCTNTYYYHYGLLLSIIILFQLVYSFVNSSLLLDTIRLLSEGLIPLIPLLAVFRNAIAHIIINNPHNNIIISLVDILNSPSFIIILRLIGLIITIILNRNRWSKLMNSFIDNYLFKFFNVITFNSFQINNHNIFDISNNKYYSNLPESSHSHSNIWLNYSKFSSFFGRILKSINPIKLIKKLIHFLLFPIKLLMRLGKSLLTPIQFIKSLLLNMIYNISNGFKNYFQPTVKLVQFVKQNNSSIYTNNTQNTDLILNNSDQNIMSINRTGERVLALSIALINFLYKDGSSIMYYGKYNNNTNQSNTSNRGSIYYLLGLLNNWIVSVQLIRILLRYGLSTSIVVNCISHLAATVIIQSWK